MDNKAGSAMPDIMLGTDVCVVDTEKLKEYYGVETAADASKEARTAVIKLYECTHSGGGNMAKKYKTYERYVPVLIKEHFVFQRLIHEYDKQVKRYKKAASARKYAKWSHDEDEALIEMVVQDDISIHELSTMFGRSPASISTRISKLVGVGRISQEIAGKFTGTLNGEEVSGTINGTLVKKQKG